MMPSASPAVPRTTLVADVPPLEGRRVVMLVSKAAHSDARVLAEAHVLAAAGASVTIYCWDRGRQFADRDCIGDIQVHNLGPRASHGGGIAQLGGYLRFWLRSLGRLLVGRWDVVHCHDFDTLWPGWLAAVLRRRVVVFDGHEPYGAAFEDTLPRPAAWMLHRMEWWLLPRVNHLLTPSEGVGAYYRARGARRSSIFENYKEPEEFDALSGSLDAARRQVAPDGELLLVHAGLLDTHVFLDVIVDAVAGLDGVVFAVAGTGRLAGWMADQAGRHANVHYLGLVPATEARRLVAAADVVNCMVRLSPKLAQYGAASNKLFDALAAGRAVLCVAATREMARLVHDADCGVVLPEGTTAAVRDALVQLRDDRDRTAALGAHARSAALQTYNRRRAAASLLQAYRDSLSTT